jgi:hypothetical protein
MSRLPKTLRHPQRIDIALLPPCELVAAPVEFRGDARLSGTVNSSTYFASERALLSKSQMVCIR